MRHMPENTLMYTIVIYNFLCNYHIYHDCRIDLTQCALTKILC